MRETDWKFDFSSLPHWENHDTFPWVYDEFLEIPQRDMLCCIYSVVEVSMLNYVGFLAILKNKENPTLFLNVSKGYNFCPRIFASRDGSLVFLNPQIYYEKTHSVKHPILIIDVINRFFSYFSDGSSYPSYKIVELRENVFGIEADADQKKHDKSLRKLCRKKIQTKRLKWRPLEELDLLPELMA